MLRSALRMWLLAVGTVCLAVLGWAPVAQASDPAPTITSITPTNGPETGGTPVTIVGTGFNLDDGFAVTIASVQCAVDTPNSTATSVQCTTGPGSPGPADVVVTNPDAQFATLPYGFTYDPFTPPPPSYEIDPTSGPAAGGNTVHITGADFDALATVDMGTGQCLVTDSSDTSIWCTAPAGEPGHVEVTVHNPGGADFPVPSGYDYIAGPTIDDITPVSGPSVGGAVVSISGADFTDSTVTVGGIACPVTSSSQTSITCTTVGGPDGPADVVVTNGDGQFDTLEDGYTYVPAPVLTRVSPAQAPADFNTLVRIEGRHFVWPSVSIGTSICSIRQVSQELIECVIGPGRGSQSVTVTNADGQRATAAHSFEYVPRPNPQSLSPASGSELGGTDVVIRGSDFRSPKVLIDGREVFVYSASDTELGIVTPAHAPGTVAVDIVNADGQSASLSFTFYSVTPAVDSVSPNSGPAAGGTTLVIRGQRLDKVESVRLGSAQCAIEDKQATVLTCVTGKGSPGWTDLILKYTVIAPFGAPSAVTVRVPQAFRYTGEPQCTLTVSKPLPVRSPLPMGPTVVIGGSVTNPTCTITAGIAVGPVIAGQSRPSARVKVQRRTGRVTVFVESPDTRVRLRVQAVPKKSAGTMRPSKAWRRTWHS